MSELLRRQGGDAACHRERLGVEAKPPGGRRSAAAGGQPSDADWLRSLMDNASNLILFKDTAGNYRCVNRQFGLMLGKPQREILGRSDHELLPGDAAAVIVANDRQVLKLLASMNFEEELPTPAGARTFLMTKFPVFHAVGEVSGIGCVGIDISERQAYRRQLLRERERAVVTLSSIGEGVIACDPECDIEYLNPVAETLLGISFADVVGRPLGEALRLRDEVSGERLDPLQLCLGDSGGLRRNGVLLRADGSELPVEETTSAIRDRDGEVLGTVMVLRDASSSRSLARRLSHEANHDPLTGLYNRREFDRVLRAAMDQAREEDVCHVLAHLDLDRFKQVNDLGGHEAGDALLRELSELLRRHLRGEDVMARLGGDEFGVLLHRCDLPAAMRVAEELRVAAERYRLLHGGQVFKTSLSIGLTRVRPDSRSLRALHDAADRAAYLAKLGGRNQIQCHEGDEVALAAAEDGLEDWRGRLEQALERGAFRLFCQEIRPLANGQDAPLRGEVLLRMKGEAGNLLLPGAFLPMAERYGLMARIDRWVVDGVLSRQAEAGLGPVALTVNLSAEALADEGFAEFVRDCLRRYPQEPGRICFEFSELTLLTAFAQSLRLLPALKAMGFSLSVERFGTGHASYGYIKALPVDYLKIDGELVRDMCEDPLNFTLVQSMNQIGHTLRKQTVAEAAEDEQILGALRDLGVDYAQGYAVARPQPLEEFGSYRM